MLRPLHQSARPRRRQQPKRPHRTLLRFTGSAEERCSPLTTTSPSQTAATTRVDIRASEKIGTSCGGLGATMFASPSACRNTRRTPHCPEVSLRAPAEATIITVDTAIITTAVLTQHTRSIHSFMPRRRAASSLIRSLATVISFRSTCGRTRNKEGGAPMFSCCADSQSGGAQGRNLRRRRASVHKVFYVCLCVGATEGQTVGVI